MGYHLRDALMPRCRSCGKLAKVELVDQYSKSCGLYCRTCGARELREARKREDEQIRKVQCKPGEFRELAAEYPEAAYSASSRTAVQLRQPLRNAEAVWEACADFVDAKEERVVVFDLDTKLGLLERRMVAVGSVNGAGVQPREVFAGALENRAVQVIIAHNHPSGSTELSPEDRALAARLRSVGEMVGVPVIDFIVVAKNGFDSLEAIGWGERSAGR
jgi:DNA repair protein RadC